MTLAIARQHPLSKVSFGLQAPRQRSSPVELPSPDPKRIDQDFLDLARIPSPGDHEDKISDFIQQLLQTDFRYPEDERLLKVSERPPLTNNQTSAPDVGEPYYIIEPDSGSIIIYVPGSRDLRPILFDTHMDMVKLGITDQTREINVKVVEPGGHWPQHLPSPYYPRYRTYYTDGKTALGGDAKASIASSLEFLRLWFQMRAEVNSGAGSAIPLCPVIITITTNEEGGGLQGGSDKIPFSYLRYDGKDPGLIAALDYKGGPDTIVYQAPQLVEFETQIALNTPQIESVVNSGVNPITPMAQWMSRFENGAVDARKGWKNKSLPGNISPSVDFDITQNIGSVDLNWPENGQTGSMNVYPSNIRVLASFYSDTPGEAMKQAKKEMARFQSCVDDYEHRLEANIRKVHQPSQWRVSEKEFEKGSYGKYNWLGWLHKIPIHPFQMHSRDSRRVTGDTQIHAVSDGHVCLELLVKGYGAHSAMEPHPKNTLSVNPVQAMADWLQQFQTGQVRDSKTKQKTQQALLSLDLNWHPENRELSTETSAKLPHNIRVVGEIRSTIGNMAAEKMKAYQQLFDNLLKAYNRKYKKRLQLQPVSGFFNYKIGFDSFYTDPRMPLLTRIHELEEMGSNGKIMYTHGQGGAKADFFVKAHSASDANVYHHLFKLHGLEVPTIVLGSAYMAPHTTSETASQQLMINLTKLQLAMVAKMTDLPDFAVSHQA